MPSHTNMLKVNLNKIEMWIRSKLLVLDSDVELRIEQL